MLQQDEQKRQYASILSRKGNDTPPRESRTRNVSTGSALYQGESSNTPPVSSAKPFQPLSKHLPISSLSSRYQSDSAISAPISHLKRRRNVLGDVQTASTTNTGLETDVEMDLETDTEAEAEAETEVESESKIGVSVSTSHDSPVTATLLQFGSRFTSPSYVSMMMSSNLQYMTWNNALAIASILLQSILSTSSPTSSSYAHPLLRRNSNVFLNKNSMREAMQAIFSASHPSQPGSSSTKKISWKEHDHRIQSAQKSAASFLYESSSKRHEVYYMSTTTQYTLTPSLPTLLIDSKIEYHISQSLESGKYKGPNSRAFSGKRAAKLLEQRQRQNNRKPSPSSEILSAQNIKPIPHDSVITPTLSELAIKIPPLEDSSRAPMSALLSTLNAIPKTVSTDNSNLSVKGGSKAGFTNNVFAKGVGVDSFALGTTGHRVGPSQLSFTLLGKKDELQPATLKVESMVPYCACPACVSNVWNLLLLQAAQFLASLPPLSAPPLDTKRPAGPTSLHYVSTFPVFGSEENAPENPPTLVLEPFMIGNMPFVPIQRVKYTYGSNVSYSPYCVVLSNLYISCTRVSSEENDEKSYLAKTTRDESSNPGSDIHSTFGLWSSERRDRVSSALLSSSSAVSKLPLLLSMHSYHENSSLLVSHLYSTADRLNMASVGVAEKKFRLEAKAFLSNAKKVISSRQEQQCLSEEVGLGPTSLQVVAGLSTVNSDEKNTINLPIQAILMGKDTIGYKNEISNDKENKTQDQKEPCEKTLAWVQPSPFMSPVHLQSTTQECQEQSEFDTKIALALSHEPNVVARHSMVKECELEQSTCEEKKKKKNRRGMKKNKQTEDVNSPLVEVREHDLELEPVLKSDSFGMPKTMLSENECSNILPEKMQSFVSKPELMKKDLEQSNKLGLTVFDTKKSDRCDENKSENASPKVSIATLDLRSPSSPSKVDKIKPIKVAEKSTPAKTFIEASLGDVPRPAVSIFRFDSEDLRPYSFAHKVIFESRRLAAIRAKNNSDTVEDSEANIGARVLFLGHHSQAALNFIHAVSGLLTSDELIGAGVLSSCTIVPTPSAPASSQKTSFSTSDANIDVNVTTTLKTNRGSVASLDDMSEAERQNNWQSQAQSQAQPKTQFLAQNNKASILSHSNVPSPLLTISANSLLRRPYGAGTDCEEKSTSTTVFSPSLIPQSWFVPSSLSARLIRPLFRDDTPIEVEKVKNKKGTYSNVAVSSDISTTMEENTTKDTIVSSRTSVTVLDSMTTATTTIPFTTKANITNANTMAPTSDISAALPSVGVSGLGLSSPWTKLRMKSRAPITPDPGSTLYTRGLHFYGDISLSASDAAFPFTSSATAKPIVISPHLRHFARTALHTVNSVGAETQRMRLTASHKYSFGQSTNYYDLMVERDTSINTSMHSFASGGTREGRPRKLTEKDQKGRKIESEKNEKNDEEICPSFLGDKSQKNTPWNHEESLNPMLPPVFIDALCDVSCEEHLIPSEAMESLVAHHETLIDIFKPTIILYFPSHQVSFLQQVASVADLDIPTAKTSHVKDSQDQSNASMKPLVPDVTTQKDMCFHLVEIKHTLHRPIYSITEMPLVLPSIPSNTASNVGSGYESIEKKEKNIEVDTGHTQDHNHHQVRVCTPTPPLTTLAVDLVEKNKKNHKIGMAEMLHYLKTTHLLSKAFIISKALRISLHLGYLRERLRASINDLFTSLESQTELQLSSAMGPNTVDISVLNQNRLDISTSFQHPGALSTLPQAQASSRYEERLLLTTDILRPSQFAPFLAALMNRVSGKTVTAKVSSDKAKTKQKVKISKTKCKSKSDTDAFPSLDSTHLDTSTTTSTSVRQLWSAKFESASAPLGTSSPLLSHIFGSATDVRQPLIVSVDLPLSCVLPLLPVDAIGTSKMTNTTKEMKTKDTLLDAPLWISANPLMVGANSPLRVVQFTDPWSLHSVEGVVLCAAPPRYSNAEASVSVPSYLLPPSHDLNVLSRIEKDLLYGQQRQDVNREHEEIKNEKKEQQQSGESSPRETSTSMGEQAPKKVGEIYSQSSRRKPYFPSLADGLPELFLGIGANGDDIDIRTEKEMEMENEDKSDVGETIFDGKPPCFDDQDIKSLLEPLNSENPDSSRKRLKIRGNDPILHDMALRLAVSQERVTCDSNTLFSLPSTFASSSSYVLSPPDDLKAQTQRALPATITLFVAVSPQNYNDMVVLESFSEGTVRLLSAQVPGASFSLPSLFFSRQASSPVPRNVGLHSALLSHTYITNPHFQSPIDNARGLARLGLREGSRELRIGVMDGGETRFALPHLFRVMEALMGALMRVTESHTLANGTMHPSHHAVPLFPATIQSNPPLPLTSPTSFPLPFSEAGNFECPAMPRYPSHFGEKMQLSGDKVIENDFSNKPSEKDVLVSQFSHPLSESQMRLQMSAQARTHGYIYPGFSIRDGERKRQTNIRFDSKHGVNVGIGKNIPTPDELFSFDDTEGDNGGQYPWRTVETGMEERNLVQSLHRGVQHHVFSSPFHAVNAQQRVVNAQVLRLHSHLVSLQNDQEQKHATTVDIEKGKENQGEIRVNVDLNAVDRRLNEMSFFAFRIVILHAAVITYCQAIFRAKLVSQHPLTFLAPSLWDQTDRKMVENRNTKVNELSQTPSGSLPSTLFRYVSLPPISFFFAKLHRSIYSPHLSHTRWESNELEQSPKRSPKPVMSKKTIISTEISTTFNIDSASSFTTSSLTSPLLPLPRPSSDPNLLVLAAESPESPEFPLQHLNSSVGESSVKPGSPLLDSSSTSQPPRITPSLLSPGGKQTGALMLISASFCSEGSQPHSQISSHSGLVLSTHSVARSRSASFDTMDELTLSRMSRKTETLNNEMQSLHPQQLSVSSTTSTISTTSPMASSIIKNSRHRRHTSHPRLSFSPSSRSSFLSYSMDEQESKVEVEMEMEMESEIDIIKSIERKSTTTIDIPSLENSLEEVENIEHELNTIYYGDSNSMEDAYLSARPLSSCSDLATSPQSLPVEMFRMGHTLLRDDAVAYGSFPSFSSFCPRAVKLSPACLLLGTTVPVSVEDALLQLQFSELSAVEGEYEIIISSLPGMMQSCELALVNYLAFCSPFSSSPALPLENNEVDSAFHTSVKTLLFIPGLMKDSLNTAARYLYHFTRVYLENTRRFATTRIAFETMADSTEDKFLSEGPLSPSEHFMAQYKEKVSPVARKIWTDYQRGLPNFAAWLVTRYKAFTTDTYLRIREWWTGKSFRDSEIRRARSQYYLASHTHGPVFPSPRRRSKRVWLRRNLTMHGLTSRMTDWFQSKEVYSKFGQSIDSLFAADHYLLVAGIASAFSVAAKAFVSLVKDLSGLNQITLLHVHANGTRFMPDIKNYNRLTHDYNSSSGSSRGKSLFSNPMEGILGAYTDPSFVGKYFSASTTAEHALRRRKERQGGDRVVILSRENVSTIVSPTPISTLIRPSPDGDGYNSDDGDDGDNGDRHDDGNSSGDIMEKGDEDCESERDHDGNDEDDLDIGTETEGDITNDESDNTCRSKSDTANCTLIPSRLDSLSLSYSHPSMSVRVEQWETNTIETTGSEFVVTNHSLPGSERQDNYNHQNHRNQHLPPSVHCSVSCGSGVSVVSNHRPVLQSTTSESGYEGMETSIRDTPSVQSSAFKPATTLIASSSSSQSSSLATLASEQAYFYMFQVKLRVSFVQPPKCSVVKSTLLSLLSTPSTNPGNVILRYGYNPSRDVFNIIFSPTERGEIKGENLGWVDDTDADINAGTETETETETEDDKLRETGMDVEMENFVESLESLDREDVDDTLYFTSRGFYLLDPSLPRDLFSESSTPHKHSSSIPVMSAALTSVGYSIGPTVCAMELRRKRNLQKIHAFLNRETRKTKRAENTKRVKGEFQENLGVFPTNGSLMQPLSFNRAMTVADQANLRLRLALQSSAFYPDIIFGAKDEDKGDKSGYPNKSRRKNENQRQGQNQTQSEIDRAALFDGKSERSKQAHLCDSDSNATFKNIDFEENVEIPETAFPLPTGVFPSGIHTHLPQDFYTPSHPIPWLMAAPTTAFEWALSASPHAMRLLSLLRFNSKSSSNGALLELSSQDIEVLSRLSPSHPLRTFDKPKETNSASHVSTGVSDHTSQQGMGHGAGNGIPHSISHDLPHGRDSDNNSTLTTLDITKLDVKIAMYQTNGDTSARAVFGLLWNLIFHVFLASVSLLIAISAFSHYALPLYRTAKLLCLFCTITSLVLSYIFPSYTMTNFLQHERFELSQKVIVTRILSCIFVVFVYCVIWLADQYLQQLSFYKNIMDY